MICCALAATIIITVLEFLRSAHRWFALPLRYSRPTWRHAAQHRRSFYAIIALVLLIAGATGDLWSIGSRAQARDATAVGAAHGAGVGFLSYICGLGS